MTIALALAAAVMYGVSDFVGGLLSRRVSVWAVALVTQVTTTILVALAALLVAPGPPAEPDLAWGAVAGVGVGLGTAYLYRGLAAGLMGVVAPISAVGAAALPVLVGLVTGERPSAMTWLGIACALPAIWLVSTAAGPSGSGRRAALTDEGVVDGLLAGLGFGVMFSALGQVPESAGLGPLALAELVSIAVIAALAALMHEALLSRDPAVWGGTVVGALAAAASVLFLLATQSGLLAVASVLTSLYPAVTVLMAATLLRERIHRVQAVGLTLAAVAIALVALG